MDQFVENERLRGNDMTALVVMSHGHKDGAIQRILFSGIIQSFLIKEDKGRSQIYFLAKRNNQYTKTQCPINLKIEPESTYPSTYRRYTNYL